MSGIDRNTAVASVCVNTDFATSVRGKDFADFLLDFFLKLGVPIWRCRYREDILSRVRGALPSRTCVAVLVDEDVAQFHPTQQLLKELEAAAASIVLVRLSECSGLSNLGAYQMIDALDGATVVAEKLLSLIEHNSDDTKSFTDQKLAVENVVAKRVTTFPLIKFTIANHSECDQRIECIEYNVIEYWGVPAIVFPRLPLPTSAWMIRLPFGTGTDEYIPKKPLMIKQRTSRTIALRLYCRCAWKFWYPCEVGVYWLSFRFRSDHLLVAHSGLVKIEAR